VSRRPWPARLAAREGILGAVSSRWTSVIVVITTALIVAGVALANAVDVSRLVAAEREWIDAGGYTYIVEPPATEADSTLSVQACERLASIEGIQGSFALSLTGQAGSVSSAPGTRATWVRVSPGVFDFFSLSPPPGPTVIVTQGIAASTAMSDGEHTLITLTRYDGTDLLETSPITATSLMSPLLGEDLNGAYLSPDLITGSAQQCYVQTDAAHFDSVGNHLATALSSHPTAPATVRPRLPDNTFGVDFATAYDDRLLGWAWAAGAVVLIAFWAVVQIARRSRLAIYATFGAHAAARLTLSFTEWAALTFVGAIWGWAWSIALAIGLGADIQIALTQTIAQTIATCGTAGLGAILVGIRPVGTLLNSLKDRT